MKRTTKLTLFLTALILTVSSAMFATMAYAESTVELNQKSILDYETAVKKAQDYSISSKTSEVQLENLQDKIDKQYDSMDGIFQIEDQGILNGTLANFEVYSTSLTTSRDLLRQQKTLETENIKISVAGGFNNIKQQQRMIDYYQNKIEYGKKNLNLMDKQLELGLVSKIDYEKALNENNSLETSLSIEKAKLSQNYSELEKITGIKNIERDYEIVPLEIEYKEIEMSSSDLDRYANAVQNYDITIMSKENAVKNKTTYFDNYIKLYNMQVMAYASGASSSKPSFDYDSTLNEKYITELDLSNAKSEHKLNVKKNYSSIENLQQNINILKSNIDSLDLALSDLEKKLELGIIPKMSYESMLITKQEMEANLEALKTQHIFLKMMFESPYFAGMAI